MLGEDISYLTEKNSLGLRDYQIEAIKAVENAILNNQKSILLSMATGTGKTRTAVGLLYRLLKSERFNRILFLVDRSELGEQAEKTFTNSKIENLRTFDKIYEIKNLDEKIINDDTKVHIATIQGLVKRIYYNNEENKPTIGQYDCIIVDEAHRGYVLDRDLNEEDIQYRNLDDYLSKYRNVLEYFDAVKIALTATPALHTAEIFGNPVYDYTYTQAVTDGYLVDYETPHIIETKLMREHIKHGKGEEVEIYNDEQQKIDKLILEDEVDIDVDGFNRRVITESYNEVICRELANRLNPEGPEKTLIFAVDNHHADKIVSSLKKEFQKIGYSNITEETVRKITGSVKDVDKLIKKFKNEHDPVIAVTVDLLSTGVDIPEISNIVFLRKVKSIILYEQMIGRATRRCDKIDKDHFNIYDAVYLYRDLNKYSRMNPVVKQVSKTYFGLIEEMQKAEGNEAYQGKILNEIIAKVQRSKIRFKNMENNLFQAETNWESPEAFIKYIKDLPNGGKISGLLKELKTLDFLEKEYKKIDNSGEPKGKLISRKDDIVEEVSQKFGKDNQRPEDYLEGFKKYVNERAEEVEALKILKTNPGKITRKDIQIIKVILDSVGYKSVDLQRAWKKVKNEEIVADILTFIKNAINGSPIVDKEERVKDVMKKIYSLADWSMPQKNILRAIHGQLGVNSIITEEDIREGLFKNEYGGYERINTQLNGMLEEILGIISQEILIN